MKILVTEDSPVYRYLLCTQLNVWNYTAEAVPDAESALAIIAQANEPVLLLVDWELPGMSGLELVSKTRALRLKHYVYAILLTARADKSDSASALNGGADDYLTKPFHELDFQARIQVAMRTLALHEELVVANEKLESLALLDPLTDLLNRRALTRAFEREQIRAQRMNSTVTLVMSDIDLFKQVNDCHGHNVGDEVIVLVAKALRDSARGSDLVARLGGDEFLLVLPDTDVLGGVNLAQRVQERLARRTEHRDVPISLSIGIAEIDKNEPMEAAIVKVDAALYAAKRNGRDQFWFEEASTSSSAEADLLHS